MVKPNGLDSLLSIKDLNNTDVASLFSLTRYFLSSRKNDLLRDCLIAQFFFEDSTRTCSSFEIAAKNLGAKVLNFDTRTSSLSKGESLLDTVATIKVMGPDCLVVRHRGAGVPLYLRRKLGVPVINAGDGKCEHPTQALLDVFTMKEKLGEIKNKNVLIVGDISSSRVAASNIHLLKMLGARVIVVGPPTLLPRKELEKIGVETSFCMDDYLEEVDVFMTLRVQMERAFRQYLPSLSEYSKYWGLSKERFKRLKSSCLLMHPGPVNWGVELEQDLLEENKTILKQMENGMALRMAVLAQICAPEKANSLIGRLK